MCEIFLKTNQRCNAESRSRAALLSLNTRYAHKAVRQIENCGRKIEKDETSKSCRKIVPTQQAAGSETALAAAIT
jgi:hypothetical protein